MKIALISDTHEYHKELEIPEADMIIHAGDYTFLGEVRKVNEFLTWFSNLPIKHKILINGNHEVDVSKMGNYIREMMPVNINYLENEGIEIEGLKFWGSPFSLAFGSGWVYQLPHRQAEEFWQQIPDDVDVLITHGPPYGYGDVVEQSPAGRAQGHLGDKAMLERVKEVKPLLHVFGHIHSGKQISFNGDTVFVNASQLDEMYALERPPVVVIEIVDKAIVNINGSNL